MGYRNFLCRVLASSHDDLSGSYGFNDVKLRDHANSGVNLWRISGDHRRHRGGGKVDSFPIKVFDYLQCVRALLRINDKEFNQEHLLDDGIRSGVLVTMHDVDQLGHLFDDLFKALRGALETDSHSTEVGIASLRYDQGFNIVAPPGKNLANPHENTGLIVYKNREGMSNLIGID